MWKLKSESAGRSIEEKHIMREVYHYDVALRELEEAINMGETNARLLHCNVIEKLQI